MAELQKILLDNYKKSLGKELLEIKEDKRTPVQQGQVRQLFITPPEFIYIANVEDDFSIVIPLTSYIQLAITDKYPPLIKWRGFNLVPLPFWVFIHNKLLEAYSIPIFTLRNNTEKIIDYVKTARTKGIGKCREEFIRITYKRYQDFNISTLIALNS